MTEEQHQRIERIIATAFGGLHNAPKIKWERSYAEMNANAGLATFDFNGLTILVIGAHEEAVRLEIGNGGPGRVKLMFHPREREGRTYERHPTIEEAVTTYRAKSSR